MDPSLSTSGGSSESLPSYPVDFDLAGDLKLEQKDFSSRQGPFFSIYIVLGAGLVVLGAVFSFGVDGGTPLLGGILIACGAAFAIGNYYVVRYTAGNRVVGLRLTDQTVEFQKVGRVPIVVEWGDPSLKVDLAQFLSNAEKHLPRGDARLDHPQWVDVFRPPSRFVKLETTLPPAAFDTILREAQRRNLTVQEFRVAFYWHSAPRSPGWLAYDKEGSVGPKHELNGRVVQIRGSAWKGVPED